MNDEKSPATAMLDAVWPQLNTAQPLSFEGSRLLMCFEHYGNCAWLQPFSGADQEVAEWLTEQWNRP